MKWTHKMEQELSESYLSVPDKELGERLGASAAAVRAHRRQMGLYKEVHKARVDAQSFVVQITNWCEKEKEIRFCTKLLQRGGVAYGVAYSPELGYAVYRQETDRIHPDGDQYTKSWHYFWTPYA